MHALSALASAAQVPDAACGRPESAATLCRTLYARSTHTGHAESVMQRVADETAFAPEWSADILSPPEVWGAERLGAGGVTIRLVVKTRPPTQWNVARQLRSRLKATFAEEGIGIPFPQQVVWHRGVEDAGPAPSADGHRPAFAPTPSEDHAPSGR